MILGSLNARSQRASNAPDPIDFLWLKTKLSLIPCGDDLSADHFPFKKTRDYIHEK